MVEINKHMSRCHFLVVHAAFNQEQLVNM